MVSAQWEEISLGAPETTLAVTCVGVRAGAAVGAMPQDEDVQGTPPEAVETSASGGEESPTVVIPLGETAETASWQQIGIFQCGFFIVSIGGLLLWFLRRCIQYMPIYAGHSHAHKYHRTPREPPALWADEIITA